MMLWRFVQSLCLGLGILQLLVFKLSDRKELLSAPLVLGCWITGLGSAVYALGIAGIHYWVPAGNLGPLGSLGTLLGFAILCYAAWKARAPYPCRLILSLIFVGMMLQQFLALPASFAGALPPNLVGASEALRWRMIRLAVMASMALPVIAYLFEGLAEQVRDFQGVVKWGRIAQLLGAAGMPLLLCLAAFVNFRIKYLLTVPVGATVLGTWCGLFLAWKEERTPEKWFWLLIALSMGVGQLMGTYAFDGPLPAPNFIGSYSDFARRLLRMGHMYAIILGIAGIIASREAREARNVAHRHAVAPFLLLLASLITLGGIFLAATGFVPAAVLAIGPALVAIALGLVLFTPAPKPSPAT